MNKNKYNAVADEIANEIRMGLWVPGSLLLKREEMCRRYHISPVTAHKVQQTLLRMGLVQARRGKCFQVLGASGEAAPLNVSLRRVVFLAPLSFEEAIRQEILSGIRQECAARRLECSSVLLEGQGSPVDPFHWSAGGDTGIVAYIDPLTCRALFSAFAGPELPLVAVDSLMPGCGAVVADHRLGMRKILDHAVQNGARRVLFAGAFQRISAWRDQEFLEAFCEYFPGYGVYGESDFTGSFPALHAHIRRFRPDALIFSDSASAVLFHKLYGDQPLLVLAFGGPGSGAQTRHVSLFRFNFHEIGRCAVELLARKFSSAKLCPEIRRVGGYLESHL